MVRVYIKDVYLLKALLKSAEVNHTIKNAHTFGIDVNHFKINFPKILERKDAIVKQLHEGVNQLMKHHHIDIYNGIGRIMGTSIFSPQSGTISVEYEDGESDILPNKMCL